MQLSCPLASPWSHFLLRLLHRWPRPSGEETGQHLALLLLSGKSLSAAHEHGVCRDWTDLRMSQWISALISGAPIALLPSWDGPTFGHHCLPLQSGIPWEHTSPWPLGPSKPKTMQSRKVNFPPSNTIWTTHTLGGLQTSHSLLAFKTLHTSLSISTCWGLVPRTVAMLTPCPTQGPSTFVPFPGTHGMLFWVQLGPLHRQVSPAVWKGHGVLQFTLASVAGTGEQSKLSWQVTWRSCGRLWALTFPWKMGEEERMPHSK